MRTEKQVWEKYKKIREEKEYRPRDRSQVLFEYTVHIAPHLRRALEDLGYYEGGDG